MSKLEVGMYVRSKQGDIGKIFLIDETFCDLEEKNGYGVNYVMYVNDIKKSSYNLIDLIEVGDYVNGMKVTRVSGTRYDDNDLHCYCDTNHNSDIEHKNVMIPAKDIKSIVTKEQFKSVEYEV